MQFKNYNIYFFFAVLIGMAALIYFMLKPFFMPFVLAVILAHAFNPVYEKILKLTGRRRGLSSSLVCALVALIIIIPIAIILYMVINEAQGILDVFSKNPEMVRNSLDNFIDNLASWKIFRSLDVKSLIDQGDLGSVVTNFSQGMLAVLGGIYSGAASLVFTLFIMFFSLFYLFIDGKKIVKRTMALSPLRDRYENMLIEKFNSIARGTIKGTFVVAAVQGLLAGIIFWIAGVPSPAFLGILTAVASIIPYVGTAMIWVPIVAVMFILSQFFSALTVLLAGIFIIGAADNILRPKLIGDDTQMHPLLVLFSTIGGILIFGAAGFIVGPIIMAFFITLLEIYSLEFKKQLDECNQ